MTNRFSARRVQALYALYKATPEIWRKNAHKVLGLAGGDRQWLAAVIAHAFPERESALSLHQCMVLFVDLMEEAMND